MGLGWCILAGVGLPWSEGIAAGAAVGVAVGLDHGLAIWAFFPYKANK